MSEELEPRKPCHLLANAEGTKIFMCFYPNVPNNTRVLIPVSLDTATIEKYTNAGNYVLDNLATVEFQAKQKGLV